MLLHLFTISWKGWKWIGIYLFCDTLLMTAMTRGWKLRGSVPFVNKKWHKDFDIRFGFFFSTHSFLIKSHCDRKADYTEQSYHGLFMVINSLMSLFVTLITIYIRPSRDLGYERIWTWHRLHGINQDCCPVVPRESTTRLRVIWGLRNTSRCRHASHVHPMTAGHQLHSE
jgi:hypothetical protein